MSSQLREMERVIGMMMRKDMEQLIKDELQQSFCNKNNETCSDPHRLTAVTLGLLRHGQFDFLQGFRCGYIIILLIYKHCYLINRHLISIVIFIW